eukprot:GFUD01043268.1.p1 GENE.GFUD01043268.1~~GFUD01043268.1.p1  ORF type:complete len:938 (-),score=240.23 GFUD01043268.1:76-2481(-)
MVVKYQDLYNLAGQLESLITAWRVRMKQCQGDWSKEQIKKLLKARKVQQNVLQLEDYEDLGTEGANPELEDKTGLDWWLRHILGAKESETTVEDRKQYSVGRGMVVFGSRGSLDQLAREIYGAKNLVQKFLIGVLASTLPVALPYPVLLSLAKMVFFSGGGTKLGWASLERASQLVESKYLNRVYLALLDIYNVIKEIMFMHAAETSSPNFSNKFAFLRSTLANNLSLLESFHQLNIHEELQAGKIFYKELKELKFKIGLSKLPEIVSQMSMVGRDRVVVNGDHIFIVQAKGHGLEAGLVLVVHLLLTGEIVKQFTAVSTSLLPGGKSTMCTQLCVLGDLVGISLSQGYPKAASNSNDKVFVVNWVEEKLVMSQTVPHSSQLIGAVRKEEYFNSETNSDYLNTSYWDDDGMVKTALGIFLTKRADHLFLLHSELILPVEYASKRDRLGEHVRVWCQQGHRMVQELKCVQMLDLQAGLLIYEEASDKGLSSNEQEILPQFDNIDMVVKWLDLVTGKEIFSKSFVGTGETPRPVYNIARHSVRDTMVLEYCAGEDLVSMYTVDVAGRVEVFQQVAFPALTRVGGSCGDLKIQLLSENLISFSHSLISTSLKSSLTRCVLAMPETEQLLAEMFIQNSKDVDDDKEIKSNGYHSLAPADRIVLEGNRIVILDTIQSGIDCDWTVFVRQYELKKSALEVIKFDEDTAKKIVEKVKTKKELSENIDTVLNVLAIDGNRQTGSIVNWCGSFGFLSLHEYPNAPNVFIHISEIRKPLPFLTAGVNMEVRLEKDFIKNKVKAVEARVLHY